MSYVSLADIQTSELLYFDQTEERACYRFCCDRDIDCLPDVDDQGRFFERDRETEHFIHKQIEPDRFVDGSTDVFAPFLLNRFDKYRLLFVRSHGVVTGVVHFSDYNRRAVNVYLYSLLFSYETTLRKLLCQYGLDNEHMFEYFQKMAQDNPRQFQRKCDEYRKNQSQYNQIPPFQPFYLADLIGLLRYRNIIYLSADINVLRNKIMHAHELVSMKDVHSDDFIYNFESFQGFFQRVRTLQQDCKRTQSRLYLRQSMMTTSSPQQEVDSANPRI